MGPLEGGPDWLAKLLCLARVIPCANIETNPHCPLRCGPTCRYEQRTVLGNITLSVTGRAMNAEAGRELSTTNKLPLQAIQMPDDKFAEILRAEFAKTLRWCRETAGIF